MNVEKIAVIVAFILAFTMIGFAAYKINKSEKSTSKPVEKVTEIQKKTRQKLDIEEKDNYIHPAQYNIGLIHDEPYKTANQCDSKVLYPIQQLKPEYGSEIPSSCPCTQFLQVP